MMFRTALSPFAAVLALLAVFGGPAAAGAIEDIKARGELIVGVKADYPPFAYRDPSGQIVGMELDLAQDLADRLGVRLKLWPVSASSRLQFLDQGSVDLVIATMAVTDERQRQAGIVEPPYYASRIALIARRDAGIRSAADLAGKSFCALRDAHVRDDILARAAGSILVPVRTIAEGAAALGEGKCAAFIEEDVRLIALKTSAESWHDFEVSPLDMPPLPWAIAVRTAEKDAPFGKLVADAVSDWHRSGRLLALEKTWLGENTPWLSEAHERAK